MQGKQPLSSPPALLLVQLLNKPFVASTAIACLLLYLALVVAL